MNKKLKNAKPKSYKAFYITPGIADYTAEGIGPVLIQKKALDKIAPTYVGKPVINGEHNDKSPEEMFNLSKGANPEDFADGIITGTGYDDESGWHWMNFLVWDQETIDNIDENGYSVSCAYDVTEGDVGGTYNNVDYAEEVLDGEGLHLVITPTPRYERAYIIKNSKGEQMATFRFLKKTVKNAPPPPAEKKPEEEEVIENADGVVDIDGEQVPLAELIKCYQEEQAGGNGATMLNEDDEVDLGEGKKAKVGDMVNAYRNRKNGSAETMENAEDPTDENAEDMVDEKKQMTNAKRGKENFQKVKNAAERGAPVKMKINTESTRLERGKSRYGSPVVQKGGK